MTSLEPGDEVDEQYLASERGLGAATGEVTDVVSLGEGGTITLSFERPLADGPGPDFAVFENGFSDGFLELAFVEVSSDGEHFVRFPSAYLGLEPIGPFNEHDPELIDGLAGKYRRGYGTPFDLSVLAWSAPTQAGLSTCIGSLRSAWSMCRAMGRRPTRLETRSMTPTRSDIPQDLTWMESLSSTPSTPVHVPGRPRC